MDRASKIAALVGLATIVASPSPGLAAEGDHAILTGVSYDRLFRRGADAGNGFGTTLGYRYGLRDEWYLWGEASYCAYLGAGGRTDLLSVFVGAAYAYDTLTWVPQVFAGVGYQGPIVGPELRPDFAVVGGIDVEYHRYREFGVGLRAEYRYMIRSGDDSSGALAITLYVARHF